MLAYVADNIAFTKILEALERIRKAMQGWKERTHEMKSAVSGKTNEKRHTDRDGYTDSQLKEWIENEDESDILFQRADSIRRDIYGDEVYVRGLIEFTNYCRNNCFYCGIRKDNRKVSRYRLTYDEILSCSIEGYKLGYRTFVMQGGEDLYYSDDEICRIVSGIKEKFPDCAVTLSIGERPKTSYQMYFWAGTDRYLLREETADKYHYGKLHPSNMDADHRKRCLWDLKEIGYQVGAGFMVGSPFQTTENIIQDLRFLQELEPDMIGIGPYLTHPETPFAKQKNGDVNKTLRLISILRILFPYALIPATTALGTADPFGREKGLKAGANVLMPNLSPMQVRKQYELYENKICTGDESAQCRHCLEERVRNAGYRIVTDRGDVRRTKR